MQPLFALLFFCAVGILVAVLIHWLERARVWPWLLVYVFFGALGALIAGLLPLTLAFALRVLAAAAFAVLIMLLLRFVRRRLDG